MISVLDYGVGNLGSILNMLKRIGVVAELASKPEQVSKANRILLPGVGSFDAGMAALSKSGMVETLKEAAVERGTPLLGICLGMQMLTNGSEEGSMPGLGLINAYCHRFHSEQMKVPHMGWNLVRPISDSPLLAGLAENSRFYFVHSYYVKCVEPESVLATTNYGVTFDSIIGAANVMGAQFHPEKSHRFGMALLRNFSEM